MQRWRKYIQKGGGNKPLKKVCAYVCVGTGCVCGGRGNGKGGKGEWEGGKGE